MKKLSIKQAENRLNKYCDKMGYSDTCGFYNNIYKENAVIYDIEENGKRFQIVFSLEDGKIKEIR